MLNSRKIELLHWKMQEKYYLLEANCKKRGVVFKCVGTVRDAEYQLQLYNQGRLTKGNIVTNCKKASFHDEKIGLAFDLCPFVNGKLDWDSKSSYKIMAEEAVKIGLTAGYYWTSFSDSPHFQLDGGLKSSDILAGKRPSWFYDKKPPTQPINQPNHKPLPIKPTEPQKPIPTIILSPIDILFKNKIISDITFWKSNAQKGRLVDCNSVKWLFRNFYKHMTKIDGDYLTSVNYCLNNSIISDKSYWIDSCNRGQTTANGEYVEIVIKNMASKLK